MTSRSSSIWRQRRTGGAEEPLFDFWRSGVGPCGQSVVMGRSAGTVVLARMEMLLQRGRLG